MGGFRTFWDGLDWSVLTNALISVIPALICITLHELAHGYVAYRLGDPTAKRAGRLTLNPIKHIDIFGLLMMVVFKFGWAKPVPVDMYNFKNPKSGMAVCALAGPVCNLIICCVFMVISGLLIYPLAKIGTEFAYTILEMVYMTAYLSLALAVFNILPIPPLDGSKVAFSFLSQESYNKLMRYEPIGMILLLILVRSHAAGSLLSTVTGFLFDKLWYISEFFFDLVIKIVG